MNPGLLRHLIYVVAPTHTQSTEGGVTQAYTVFGTVWGSVAPLSGRERFAAGQIDATIDHRVIMRYLPGVRDDMQLLVPKEETTLTATHGTSGSVLPGVSYASVTLARDFSVTDESFPARIESEIVLITGFTGLTAATTRAQYGTTEATHASGTVIVRLGVLEINAIIDRDERREQLELLCTETR